MTIEDLRNRKKKRDESRAAMAKELKGLKVKAENLEKEAKAASDAGDLDLFMKKKREARDAADLIEFKEAQLANASQYDSEEVAKQVWLDYEKKEFPKLRKEFEAFQKSKKALADQMASLAAHYSAMVSYRQQCAELAGIFGMSNWPLDNAPWTVAELNYFGGYSEELKAKHDRYFAEAARIGI